MRLLHDSVTARDIPREVAMVAGYVDGRYRWSDEDWNRFGNAVKIRIAIFPSTNDGHVLDVEPGNAGPADYAVGQWVLRRRAAGVEPSIYCPLSWWDDLQRSFATWGITPPQWWVAHWNSRADIPNGAVAKQYRHGDIALGETHYSGGHFDLSAVADHWPGVDGGTPGGGGAPALPPTEEGWEYYVIQRGDTLSGIAARFGTTWQTLKALNAIPNEHVIFPGKRLKVRRIGEGGNPAPVDRGWYRIQPGDTLGALARRWGTTVDAIARLNGISNPDLIFAGNSIRIPA